MKIRPNPPFRVLHDLRWMELGKAGGIEQANHELLAAISHLDRKNSHAILAPRSASWEWDFPPGFNVSRLYSDAGEPTGERFHASVAQRLANPAMDRSAFGELDFDLVHSTCSYIHPEVISFPGVLTIQDLQHLHYPEFFSKADLDDRERLYRESAARALHIICGSEFTRMDVHERFGVPLERLTTIWNIPGGGVWREIPASERRALLAGMGIFEPFLLYPAHSWPHKNHARLVQAVALVDDALPPELKIVLTGQPFPRDHAALAALREEGLETRIVHLGYRSPLEIRALFQECMALVFPSLFEGFGMPVAEAIIAGKPVICSDRTSIPEIAGDAAATFDPHDVKAIAARILEIVTSPGLRRSLANAAQRRRGVFSARASAIRTLAVYERVAASRPASPS